MGSLLGQLLAPRNAASPGPPVPGGSGGMVMPGSSTGASPDLTLIKAYKMNGTVFANVSLLASSVAAQKWALYRSAPPSSRYTTSDQGSDQRQQVAVHAALNVLENPASILVPSGRRWPIWDRFGLFEISQIYLEQTGKSHWVVDTAERSSPIPLGLWPVRPDRMTPVPDKDRYLAGWLYKSPDGREVIPLYPDEVIFNRYPDPEDPYGGAGPIRSVITDIQAADYAAEWNKNYFINSAEPGGVIQVDHELQENEFDELVDRWRETHRGVARAHRIAVLEAGQTWVANNHSARDMDFANLRSVSRDIIREGLGMHKVMTGVTDDVNRANAQTGEEVFSSWKVAPRLARWRNVLNTQFLPLFGATAVGNEFDFNYPTPQNREQDNAELMAKVNAAGILVRAGFERHAVLAAVGLPDMETSVVQSPMPALPPGWMPGSAGGQPAAAPDDDAVSAALQAAGWDSPVWRQMAVFNQLQGAR
jgi:phage portal protein BeeE